MTSLRARRWLVPLLLVAVVRNRVRRRIREALRVMAPSFQPGWDVLIIARPAIVEADHDALVGALQRTLVRGGVLGGTS